MENNNGNHPLYIDYLKTTDNLSLIGFDQYCWEQYCFQQNEQLKKYSQRNDLFLEYHNHSGTFNWVNDYLKSGPTEKSRSIAGDTFFNAHLKVMAGYNSLMMELSRDELDEQYARYFLDRIRENMQFLIANIPPSSL